MTVVESALPYVVSGDAEGLMSVWQQGSDYSIPSKAFFSDLALDLHRNLSETTGHPVIVVGQAELHDGMEVYLKNSPYPVVSLDRAYFSGNDSNVIGHIDVTRAVNPKFEGFKRLRPRPGAKPVNSQIETIAAISDKVVLLDDVIFAGKGVVEIADLLKQRGCNTVGIIAGIAISKGVREIEKAGIEVKSVLHYEDVLDEVCERDFLAGIPMSGRTVYEGSGGYWSAPYFKPFGDPEGWATIPTPKADVFSRFCLKQTIELWSAVDKASGHKISLAELPRPLRLPSQARPAVEALTGVLDN